MRRLGLVVAFLAGCSNELGAPQTRYLEPALATTALTAAPQGHLLPAPGGAALVAVGATDVRWGLLSANGRLTGESSAPLPALTLGPWVGLASASSYGDRVVVVWGEPKAGNVVRLAAMMAGDGGADATIVELGEVPLELAPSLRVSVASDVNGAGVAVATAIAAEGQPSGPVTVRVVRPGASEPIGGEVRGLPASWRCLSLVPSRAAFAVSAVSTDPADVAGDKTAVIIEELGGDAHPVFVYKLVLTVRKAGCPVVSATPGGYLLAMQTDDGTFLSHYDIAAQAAPTDFVLGSVRFGGPSKQPPVQAVASVGRVASVLLDRATGPEVWSFDLQGRIAGGPLRLPVGTTLADAHVLTGLPVAGELWVSYLDGASRRFLRVQSDASSADQPDAATRD